MNIKALFGVLFGKVEVLGKGKKINNNKNNYTAKINNKNKYNKIVLKFYIFLNFLIDSYMIVRHK